MKRILGIFIAICILVASSVCAYAWITNPKSAFTVKMKDSGGISLSLTKADGYSGLVNGETKEIGCCTSTNGILFTDKDGNSSTEYAQYTFYVKGDSNYDTLYVENLNISPACDSLKIAVEYESLATILDTQNFSKTSLKRAVETTPNAVKVRVWFDGETTTSYIADDISIELEFSAS